VQHFRSTISIALCIFLGAPTLPAQAPQYKLTIVDNASTQKRVKKGRVSSQAVVKVTDENDVPVAGIAVLFTIPQFTGSGATFASGAFTSTVATNAAGVASSSTFTASAGSFNMAVAASTPGGTVTTAVPVSVTAAVAGAGVSTGVIVAIIAAVGGAAGAGIALAGKGGGGNSPNPNPPTPAAGPAGTISGPGSPTLGPSK
jgi:hypothetical protein